MISKQDIFNKYWLLFYYNDTSCNYTQF